MISHIIERGRRMREGTIQENIKAVEDRIAAECQKAGRDPEDVTLIAVSKTKPVEMLREAYEYGCRDFGENKVQELLDKYEEMPRDIRWHMIGHLQRNKVKYIVDKVYLIHSVDSLRLAEEICKKERMCEYPGGSQCGKRGDKVWNNMRRSETTCAGYCKITQYLCKRFDDDSAFCRKC
jgi:6-phosphofructokinase